MRFARPAMSYAHSTCDHTRVWFRKPLFCSTKRHTNYANCMHPLWDIICISWSIFAKPWFWLNQVTEIPAVPRILGIFFPTKPTTSDRNLHLVSIFFYSLFLDLRDPTLTFDDFWSAKVTLTALFSVKKRCIVIQFFIFYLFSYQNQSRNKKHTKIQINYRISILMLANILVSSSY